MAEERTVLVFGHTQSIVNEVEIEVRRLGISFLGTTDEDEAVNMARANPVDALLVVGGVTPDERRRAWTAIRRLHPKARMIEPIGPGMVEAPLRDAFRL